MGKKSEFTTERLKRLSRMYASSTDAALAAGCHRETLRQKWKEEGIPTPEDQKRQAKKRLRQDT